MAGAVPELRAHFAVGGVSAPRKSPASKVYGATTSFTVVARTSFTPGVEFSVQEAESVALEEDGRERATDTVCDSRVEWSGAAFGSVPGVWHFAPDWLFMATPVPAGRELDGAGGTESATPAECGANG